jgi:hypothetical protein
MTRKSKTTTRAKTLAQAGFKPWGQDDPRKDPAFWQLPYEERVQILATLRWQKTKLYPSAED